MAWTHEKIEETLKSVVEKGQEDIAFREKLKSNPKEVLAAEAGEMIPEFIRIAVVDQNDADIVITLPKVQSDECSDVDLEHVAGGKPDAKTVCMVVSVTNTVAGAVATAFGPAGVPYKAASRAISATNGVTSKII